MAVTLENTSPFQLSTDRLRSLCDVVMGAVLVVLILNIDFPDLSTVSTTQTLLNIFYEKLTSIFSFLLCFLVVAKCWEIHNLLFYHVKNADRRIVWLTMLYLFCVIFLIFTSGIHIRFTDKTIVMIFSISLMMPAFILSMLCARVVYSWKLDESIYISETRKRASVILMLKIFLIPAIAIFSFILTYVDVLFAYYVWSLMLIVIFV